MNRLRALERHIGYRGSVLLFFALWSLGNAARLAWPPPEVAAGPAFAYLASIAPLSALAAPWALVGVLCLVQAFTVADTAAFAALSGLLVAWAVVYLVGGLLGAIPQAAWAVIIQVVVAGLVLRISRWPEPSRGA
ncbi:hypothetical protein [Spongiactinospora sp. TRM90649]|uniref:hypothetical protein n=1 Tax=Spongiactinospora sp. TRM90649 TaxID=3031114 RepID=UPI0023F9BA95|nr:hypothetical protein [Spongiactinospora sp. TRM90649]MDF5755829.1 hypothetical protein [Spongiactinospora sp. TRM90649]